MIFDAGTFSSRLMMSPTFLSFLDVAACFKIDDRKAWMKKIVAHVGDI